MKKRKQIEDVPLKYLVETRLGEVKYNELTAIILKNPNENMSSLIRKILLKQPITVYTRDLSLDNTMEELARLRNEVRAIGVNINQITRFFNTYPDERRKLFFAKMAFSNYEKLEPKIECLLLIITKLSKKWLSE